MSNEYGFFASKNHDRLYSADDFSAFFGDFFTDGVLGSDTNTLMVSAAGDMAVSVAAGTAYIKGRWYRRQSPQLLTLADSDTEYDRIDAVVIRCDYVERMVYPYIIEGVPDETAVEPSPVRDEKYYDIVLAYVYVAANCVEVTETDITDKRGFDDVCGYVTSAIDHIDTSGLFAQYEAQWELLKAGCAQDADAVIAAWSALSTVKTINNMKPINGNIALTQSLIPSDGTAYQFPYYIQSGTVSVSGNSSGHSSATITFPKKFKSAPLMLISINGNIAYSTGYASISTAVVDITESGATIKAWRTSDSGSMYQIATSIAWAALGEPEE
ncbi:MAG: H-type lectin domain-containing protein [Oscillospiraceae bacterium]